MNNIEYRLLQGAIVVAEEMNFSRAAARLGITQPALTKRVHDLEQRIGVVLFERTNRGVELTDACRAFIEDARLSLIHLDRAIQRAKASTSGVEEVLHLGRSPYIDPYFVTVLTSTRLALYPKLRIELSGNFSAELSRQVLAGELDMALVTRGSEMPTLNYLKIDTLPFFVLFRESDEQLAALAAIKLSDLQSRPWALFGRHVHPFLHDLILSKAKTNDIQPLTLRGIQSAEEAAQLIVQFGGIAFLARTGAWRCMEAGLTMRPLAEESLQLETVLITRADDDSRLLSEFVRSAMKRLAGVRPAQRELALAV